MFKKAFAVFRNHPVIASLALATLGATIAMTTLWLRPNETDTAKPRRGPVIEAVYGIGTVTSRKQYRARVGTANAIRAIFVHEGQLVERGTRLIDLQEGGGILAPFRGTITSIPFYAGETVISGTIILTLQDLTDLYVLATLEQQGALRVRPGMSVRLNFESIRNQTFTGQVRSVYPQENQFLVDIQVNNLPSNILPGMTSDVAIEVGRKEDALLIPLRAISNGKVVVSRGNSKKKVDVKIGNSDGEWAEVTGGDLGQNDLILLPRR